MYFLLHCCISSLFTLYKLGYTHHAYVLKEGKMISEALSKAYQDTERQLIAEQGRNLKLAELPSAPYNALLTQTDKQQDEGPLGAYLPVAEAPGALLFDTLVEEQGFHPVHDVRKSFRDVLIEYQGVGFHTPRPEDVVRYNTNTTAQGLGFLALEDGVTKVADAIEAGSDSKEDTPEEDEAVDEDALSRAAAFSAAVKGTRKARTELGEDDNVAVGKELVARAEGQIGLKGVADTSHETLERIRDSLTRQVEDHRLQQETKALQPAEPAELPEVSKPRLTLIKTTSAVALRVPEAAKPEPAATEAEADPESFGWFAKRSV